MGSFEEQGLVTERSNQLSLREQDEYHASLKVIASEVVSPPSPRYLSECILYSC